MNNIKSINFNASKSSGNVSGLLLMPKNSKAVLVFAHGAGAPMDHPFMHDMALHLAEQNIGTLRYNFPYTEKRSRRIDPPQILIETVKSAVTAVKKYSEDIPIYAGGKSMGGRMTSQAAAVDKLEDVKGLIFFGFPLHPVGKESTDRADHLFKINMPLLFLQGSRDRLANLNLFKPIIESLGKKALLHVLEGADHSFHMLKSSGISDEQVLAELAKTTSDWIT